MLQRVLASAHTTGTGPTGGRDAFAPTAGDGRQLRRAGDEELADAQDTTYETAKSTASRLAKNGWLTRLNQGVYLIVPLAAGENAEYTAHEFHIASYLADPMYVGFWSALGYHGLTEQVPQSVYLATTKRLAFSPGISPPHSVCTGSMLS